MFPQLFRTVRTAGFQRKLSGEVNPGLANIQKQSNTGVVVAIIIGFGLYGYCNGLAEIVNHQMNDVTFLKSEVKQLNAKVEKLEKEREVSNR